MNPTKLAKLLGLDDIVGLDYETYYDSKGYSLRSPKISTSEYVRDERFKAQCLGYQTLRMRKPKWVPYEKVESTLKTLFPEGKRVGLLAHHAAFDGFITSQHYGIVPAFYFCSMSMARPLFNHDIGASLDELSRYLGHSGKTKKGALEATKGIRELPKELLTPLGNYCADDVYEMWLCFRDMLPHFPVDEIRLIDITIRAFAAPTCLVDIPRVQKELDREIKAKNELIQSAGKILKLPADTETISKELSSGDKFAKALRNCGTEPPLKPSPSHPEKQIYAFAKNDLAFQALEHSPDPTIRTLVKARLAVKSTIGETRAARMILRGTTGDCRLPLYLNYGKARTLRWTGGDKFNPQNFVRGGELRRSIIAPKGHKIVVVDSSQIEARMNAWLWGQDDLLEIFAEGRDPYCELASVIYGRKITKKDKLERFVGKVAVLGLGYGMGAEKFQYTLAIGALGPPVDLPLITCEKVVSIYRSKNYKIRAGWRFLEGMLTLMLTGSMEKEYKDILYFYKESINTISGFTLHYPHLSATINPRTESYQDFTYINKNKPVKIYGAKLNENIVQHLSRLVVAEQMLTIAEQYPIITMTHDEVVYLAPTHKAKQAYEFGLEAFTTAPEWCPDIPLDAEGGYDTSYSK